jgi:hypothetical protein
MSGVGILGLNGNSVCIMDFVANVSDQYCNLRMTIDELTAEYVIEAHVVNSHRKCQISVPVEIIDSILEKVFGLSLPENSISPFEEIEMMLINRLKFAKDNRLCFDESPELNLVEMRIQTSWNAKLSSRHHLIQHSKSTTDIRNCRGQVKG